MTDFNAELHTVENALTKLLRSVQVIGPGSKASTTETIDAHWFCTIRRRRDRIFGPHAELFSDPAWEILLELHRCRAIGIPVAATAASIAGGIPQTTGLRYLNALHDHGLIVRRADPADRRRIWVELSHEGELLMDAWLATFGKLRIAD